VLGIFARERLDLATLWTAPAPTDPVAFVFRLYCNYDGDGAAFGRAWVRAASSDQSVVSIYAARRDDGALTAMLVNKSVVAQACPFHVAGFAAQHARAEVFRYSAADLAHILRLDDLWFVAEPDGLTPVPGSLDLPPSSLTLLVLRFGAGVGDLDCNGAVDFGDINPFVLALADPGQYGDEYPDCDAQNADCNGDGIVDFGDVNPFVDLLAR
jgi:hypothetical protein